MRADPEVDAEWPASPSRWLREEFLRLVRADREAITASFARLFDETYAGAASDPVIRVEAMTAVSDVLSDVELSVSSGKVRIGADLGAWAVVWAERDSHVSPADGVNAMLMFVDIALSSFAAYLAANPELLPCFRTATQAMNVSTGRFVRLMAGACVVRHSTRVQSDERRRLARELHDRVGEVLSVGLRRLDLQEMDRPCAAPDRENVARDVLVTAMNRLRTVTSDLREAPLTSIEKALNEYLDSFRARAKVELRISGDEKRASPVMLEETFLIVREAVRNALTHGVPQGVQIVVEISSEELRARVVDDGCGFELGSIRSDGVGIASMQERAALMGGKFWISSRPGDGTCVEVRLPLLRDVVSADAVYEHRTADASLRLSFLPPSAMPVQLALFRS